MVDRDIVRYSIFIKGDSPEPEYIYIKQDTQFGYTAAHRAIRITLRNLLRYRKNITPDTIVTIEVKDGSGYFSTCPEIFPGYYKKTLKISEYLTQ